MNQIAHKQIIKISDNEFRISGICNYWEEPDVKIIDGVRYVREDRGIAELDLDVLWEENSIAWGYIEFKELDFIVGTIKVYYPKKFWADSIIKNSINRYSENLTVCVLSHLVKDHKVGDGLIWDIVTRNDSSSIISLKCRSEYFLMHETIVTIPVYWYGWNNVLYVDMTVKDFLRLDLHKLNENTKRYLIHLFKDMIDEQYFYTKPMTDADRRKIALIILQTKIKYKN